jgi:DNA-binding transcriptional regulator LsrR (DeoR family)
MLARPSAGHSHKVLLQDHLPALRALTEVLVVPDNDVDADKNQTGRAAADELSSWLLSRRVNASTVLLPELGAPNDCKDFADWAVNSNL